ncbi:MAG: stage II sporulation protein M [Flavobacteriales bacterium]|nr:stage II sporulation protein M [Flavobacteriales bacterium]
MREAAFVKRNNGKWRRLELLVAGRSVDITPDEASALYIELNDDLSYARTFYPGAKVTGYLNTLAAGMHRHIYRNQRTGMGRFISFWITELPLLMASSRKQLAIAAGVFLVAVIIGGISARYDADFTRLVMGDGYVDMTLENIKEGKPMAVYGSAPMMDMFFGITLNNIKVSFYAFAFGLLLSYGTWMILVQNGIMLGTFQYFMYDQGVLRESLMGIWLHGTVEISCIVIAGAAGIVMGNSILFPGTYTRLASFRRGALKGVKIVMGLVPCFILAGFIESFITRRSATMPPALNIAIIGGSLAFIIGYFILYPYHVERTQQLHRATPTA